MMRIASSENVVRAICSDKWDGQRLSPSLFKGLNTSVSRLAIIPLAEHWELFRGYVERPPARRLEMIGEINVGQLEEIGRAHQPAVELTVEPDPLEWNRAHAVIPQRINRGLANSIVKRLQLHSGNEPRAERKGRG